MNKKIVAEVFASNKEIESLFVTSDDNCFDAEYKAEGHASGLEDNTVTKVHRIDFEKTANIKASVKDEAETAAGQHDLEAAKTETKPTTKAKPAAKK